MLQGDCVSVVSQTENKTQYLNAFLQYPLQNFDPYELQGLWTSPNVAVGTVLKRQVQLLIFTKLCHSRH